jgi:hypothetical protein
MKTYRAHEDATVLNAYLEVPGPGFLPVNAFVLHPAQPVVIDAGLDYPTALSSRRISPRSSIRRPCAGSD